MLDLAEIFSDPNGDDLTITAMTDGGVGGLVEVEGTDLTFNPAKDENGPVTITVKAEDGNGGAAETSFELNLAAVNDAPEGDLPVGSETNEDTPFVLDLKPLFSDVEDDVLSFSASLAEASPIGAGVSVADGVLTVTPGANDSGTVLVDVEVDDGNEGGKTMRQLTLTVNPVNDAPEVANPIDDQDGTEDTTFTLDISDVFADVDGDALEIDVSVEGDVGGEASIEDGVLSFVPAPNGNGLVVITLTAADAGELFATESFNLNIAPVNDAPVAEDDDGFSVEAGGTLLIDAVDVLSNDTDIDSVFGLESVTSGTGGTVTLLETGISFESDGTEGPATFTYTITDGLLTDTATVTVNVLGDPGEFNVITGDPVEKNVLRGTDVADLITGGSGKDIVRAGGGNDSVEGGDGSNALRGEAGNDTLVGGAHRDRLFGGEGDDLLMGLGGKDRLDGGDDNDTLIGGEENDRLFGGTGADQLIGEGGNDVLGLSELSSRIGDGAADEIIFGNDDGRDKVYGFESGLDMITLDGADVYSLRTSGDNTVLEFGDTTAIFYDVTVLMSDIDYL